jgi:hypothetical protein
MILTAICLLGYPLGIQAKRKGWNYLWLPLAYVITVLDWIANYTEWVVVFGKPAKGCYTISKRLDWMEENAPTPAQRELAHMVNVFLNACEQDGAH